MKDSAKDNIANIRSLKEYFSKII